MGRRPSISMSNSSRWSTLPGDRAKSGALPPSPFSKIKARHVYSLAIAAFLVLFSSPLHSHNFYVTNTKDDGSEGTFRWAVGMCDWYPEICDTVMFAIPLNDPGYDPEIGVWTVRWDTLSFNAISLMEDCALIDGFSQRRFIGRDTNPFGPEIELEGPAQYGYNNGGIDIVADDIVIRGLCISGCSFAAIDISGWPGDELAERIEITGCYLGCDPTGTRWKGGRGPGIHAGDGVDIRIGGDDPEERNVISGYGLPGVHIGDCGTFQIINNIIGLDRTGTSAFDPDGFQPQLYVGHNLETMGPSVIRNNIIGGDGVDNVDIVNVFGDSAVITLNHNLIGIGIDGSPHGGNMNVSVVGGGGHRIIANTIAYATSWHGIYLVRPETDYVTISRNSIFGTNRIGIDLANHNSNGFSLDAMDGTYGPGVNEEIDACVCDSAVSREDNQGSTTTAYFTCMPDCLVEVFITEENGYHGWCPILGHGDVYSGKTYLGDAEEIVPGEIFSSYSFSISPALPEGTRLTTTATNANGSTSEFGCTCEAPLLGETEPGCRPSEPRLLQPTPNPCAGSTTIIYHVADDTDIRLAVYDAGGRRVATVVDRPHRPGIYGIRWKARDESGRLLPNGSYILRLESDDFVGSTTLSVLR